MREYVTSYKECETTDHVKYTLPIEKNEEIVRCRDCYHYRDISTKHARSGGIGTCDLGLEWTDL